MTDESQKEAITWRPGEMHPPDLYRSLNQKQSAAAIESSQEAVNPVEEKNADEVHESTNKEAPPFTELMPREATAEAADKVQKEANSATAEQQRQPRIASQEFKLINVLEEIKAAPEKIPFLVDELLLEVGVSMLCAKPKTGKSTLAVQLSVAVAEGKEFFGRGTLAGDVLYLLLEGPKRAFTDHAKKMGYTAKHGKIHLVHQRMPPTGEMGLKELVKAIKKLPNLRLVIVDPGAKLLRFLDSYKPEEVTTALENLESIAKDYNLQVLFLTHGKKRETDDPGDAAMGATAFRGGTDTNIYLIKKGVERMITIEQRLGVGLEWTLLSGWNEETQTVNLGETLESLNTRKKEGKQKNSAERIEKAIVNALFYETSGLTQTELLGKVTGNTQAVLNVLNGLVAAGTIKSEQRKKSIRYWHEFQKREI